MTKFKQFSRKQLLVLTWWCDCSRYREYDAIICDGAVRSGKTLCMSISFISWAFSCFDGYSFALCGKTAASLSRNVITPLLGILNSLGFECEHKISRSYMDIAYKNRRNRFYLFGGKDEGSAALIQGVTLAGVMFDEAALMPRSFVEQALARCSIHSSKFWFNCNPEHPFHWFYLEWVKKAKQKNAFYVHFTMKDNPSLSRKILSRYESLYSGSFYDRFILGKWTAAVGAVFPMFDARKHIVSKLPEIFENYHISCDYGTVNPASFGLWGKRDEKYYRIREYYYDSKKNGDQKTDEEYYNELVNLAGNAKIQSVIIDPSAASFIQLVRRKNRFRCIPAKNEVSDGIRKVANMLKAGKLLFYKSCTDCIREFALYSWDDNNGRDIPKKQNDHAMDDVRYFVSTALEEGVSNEFFVLSSSR
ncbi:MAG: PBSX family phage terminase large subunit [Oscillospiraceae bacterium]|nr:PBSX family phage terminase large subunit [Oscillospiraceae bacterium]